MAIDFPYVTAAICEKVLVDQDGIPSLIRIFDQFNIAADAPEDVTVSFYVFASLKTSKPSSEELKVGVNLVRANGERVALMTPAQPVRLAAPSEPNNLLGINVNAQVNLKIRNFGLVHIEVEINGEVFCRLPLTLRKLPPAEEAHPEQRN